MTSPTTFPIRIFGCEAEQDSIEEELERLVKEQEEEEDAMDVASPSSSGLIVS